MGNPQATPDAGNSDAGEAVGSDAGPTCVPAVTCQSLGHTCGTTTDDCGKELPCGPCASGTCRDDGTCPTIETCDTKGWCELKPIPEDQALTSMWGVSEADLWISSLGPMLHWDGAQLSPRPSAPRGVVSLSGLAADKLWAVGGHSVWRYDGTSWTEMRQFAWWPEAIHVVADGASFALAVVGHWGDPENNSTWSNAFATFRNGLWKDDTSAAPVGYGPHLLAVWGARADEIWAVGVAGGGLWKFDGTSWALIDNKTESAGLGIGGTSASNVYIAGYSGIVRRYNGTSWSSLPQLTSGGKPYGYPSGPVYAISASDIWVAPILDVLFHSTDGVHFTTLDLPGDAGVDAMWGGPTILYAAGHHRFGGAGALYRYRR